jgi:hypothetical protein
MLFSLVIYSEKSKPFCTRIDITVLCLVEDVQPHACFCCCNRIHTLEQGSSFATPAVRMSPFLMDMLPTLLSVSGFLLKSLGHPCPTEMCNMGTCLQVP